MVEGEREKGDQNISCIYVIPQPVVLVCLRGDCRASDTERKHYSEGQAIGEVDIHLAAQPSSVGRWCHSRLQGHWFIPSEVESVRDGFLFRSCPVLLEPVPLPQNCHILPGSQLHLSHFVKCAAKLKSHQSCTCL